MEEAIKTVCIASLKFSAFYGLWTWLIHTVFRANFVVIPAGNSNSIFILYNINLLIYSYYHSFSCTVRGSPFSGNLLGRYSSSSGSLVGARQRIGSCRPNGDPVCSHSVGRCCFLCWSQRRRTSLPNRSCGRWRHLLARYWGSYYRSASPLRLASRRQHLLEFVPEW